MDRVLRRISDLEREGAEMIHGAQARFHDRAELLHRLLRNGKLCLMKGQVPGNRVSHFLAEVFRPALIGALGRQIGIGVDRVVVFFERNFQRLGQFERPPRRDQFAPQSRLADPDVIVEAAIFNVIERDLGHGVVD